MPGQFNPLEALLGIDPATDPTMLMQAGALLPGQTDDMLLSMPTALGGFDMNELMSLLNGPSIPSNGVRMPQADQTAVVRPAARPTMRQTQAPATRPKSTGRTDLQERQRAAQKMEIRRGQMQRQAKKKQGY